MLKHDSKKINKIFHICKYRPQYCCVLFRCSSMPDHILEGIQIKTGSFIRAFKLGFFLNALSIRKSFSKYLVHCSNRKT
jgi:hypothetical protein